MGSGSVSINTLLRIKGMGIGSCLTSVPDWQTHLGKAGKYGYEHPPNSNETFMFGVVRV